MNTVTLPIKTIEKVEKQLVKALEEVRQLKQVRSDKEKPTHFWTKAEWDKSEAQADADIVAGRVKKFNSVEELIKELNS